jgi:molecular chaperone GrpE
MADEHTDKGREQRAGARDAGAGEAAEGEGIRPQPDVAEDDDEAAEHRRPPRAAPDTDPESLARQLEETRAKLREVNDRLLRTAADFDNFRKRAQREKEQYVARAGDNIVREILPVLDNFARALQARDANHDLAALATGIDMIYRQLGDVLERMGIESFESVGQRFDPALHEAIQQVTSPAHAPGTIVSEFARGYRMGGKLLRPALVVVADAASGAALPGGGAGGGGGEAAGNGHGDNGA